MVDAEIISLFFERSEKAIAAAQETYGAYCFTVAENVLHNREDAEECVSDTMLRAWQSIPPQKPMRLRLFLAKITRNLAFDRYRRDHAEKRGGGEIEAVLDELAECVPSEEDVEADFDRRALAQCISDFLREQPQRERQIFLRRYFYADSVKDIAQEFGLNANHTSVLLRRTRQKLIQYLKKEGYVE